MSGSNEFSSNETLKSADDTPLTEPRVRGRTYTTRLAVAVFVVIIAASSVTSYVTHRVVRHQEHQLLEARAGDIEGLVSSGFTQTQTAMEAISAGLANSKDAKQSFDLATTPLLGPNRYANVGLVTIDAGETRTIYTRGTGAASTGSGGAFSDTIRRAIASPGKLTAGPVFTLGSERRLGLAMRPLSLAPQEAIYIEVVLAPFDAAAITPSSPFNELRLALYLGDRVDSNAVILTTTDKLPLTGDTVTRRVTQGNDTYLLVTNARHSLVGTLASALPWIVLAVGALLGLFMSLLVGALARRRDFAERVAQQRTLALTESMSVLRERVNIDTMLRRASRDVANAPDIQVALDALCGVIRDYMPVDRLTFSVPDSDQMRVVAVSGTDPAGTVAVGSTVSMHTPLLEMLFKDKRVQSYNPTEYSQYRSNMRSLVMVPLVAAGKIQAVLALACKQEGVYSNEDSLVLESLGRATGAVFNQLILLEREREAKQRLEELDRLKDEFVGIVAHDLRSPMTVIAGFADLIRINRDRLTDAQKDEYLERISVNIKNLAELVEDILQVARIESGELHCKAEPFDLAKLVRVTATEMRETGDARPCIIDIPPDLPYAVGDEQRQWQIITNLLSNAFKYSTSDQPVRVSMLQKGNMLEVAVQDAGIGISNDDISRLFEKFSRVGQSGGAGKIAGTGLGLYIARSLVEAQGGRIWVESEVGRGSTFTYSTPAAASQRITIDQAAVSQN